MWVSRAGEPHARFEAAAGGARQTQSATPCGLDASRRPYTKGVVRSHQPVPALAEVDLTGAVVSGSRVPTGRISSNRRQSAWLHATAESGAPDLCEASRRLGSEPRSAVDLVLRRRGGHVGRGREAVARRGTHPRDPRQPRGSSGAEESRCRRRSRRLALSQSDKWGNASDASHSNLRNQQGRSRSAHAHSRARQFRVPDVSVSARERDLGAPSQYL
jgi:hypothetical protein